MQLLDRTEGLPVARPTSDEFDDVRSLTDEERRREIERLEKKLGRGRWARNRNVQEDRSHGRRGDQSS